MMKWEKGEILSVVLFLIALVGCGLFVLALGGRNTRVSISNFNAAPFLIGLAFMLPFILWLIWNGRRG